MAYLATVVQVMIASPSDVAPERQLIQEVIREWNSIHSFDRGIILMPASWETHAAPLMGERPQEVINRQVLEGCDLLIGVFWTRIGTATGASISGTAEEIERHKSAGKPVMLYFSTAPVRPDSIDPEQYQQLKDFKNKCMADGLVETYDSLAEFRQKLARQLAITIIQNRYLTNQTLHNPQHRPSLATREEASGVPPRPHIPDLSKEAMALLIQASQDSNGTVLVLRTMGGMIVQTNEKQFVEPDDPRSEAAWEAAVSQLLRYELLQDQGYKREVFSVTHEGYRVADLLKVSTSEESDIT